MLINFVGRNAITFPRAAVQEETTSVRTRVESFFESFINNESAKPNGPNEEQVKLIKAKFLDYFDSTFANHGIRTGVGTALYDFNIQFDVNGDNVHMRFGQGNRIELVDFEGKFLSNIATFHFSALITIDLIILLRNLSETKEYDRLKYVKDSLLETIPRLMSNRFSAQNYLQSDVNLINNAFYVNFPEWFKDAVIPQNVNVVQIGINFIITFSDDRAVMHHNTIVENSINKQKAIAE